MSFLSKFQGKLSLVGRDGTITAIHASPGKPIVTTAPIIHIHHASNSNYNSRELPKPGNKYDVTQSGSISFRDSMHEKLKMSGIQQVRYTGYKCIDNPSSISTNNGHLSTNDIHVHGSSKPNKSSVKYGYGSNKYNRNSDQMRRFSSNILSNQLKSPLPFLNNMDQKKSRECKVEVFSSMPTLQNMKDYKYQGKSHRVLSINSHS